jgi:hypothetical protein
MFIKFDFSPSSPGDFFLKISCDDTEPESGSYIGPFIDEAEVYKEFAKLEAEVQKAKQKALQLVQRASIEEEKGVGSAHRAYKSILKKVDPNS